MEQGEVTTTNTPTGQREEWEAYGDQWSIIILKAHCKCVAMFLWGKMILDLAQVLIPGSLCQSIILRPVNKALCGAVEILPFIFSSLATTEKDIGKYTILEFWVACPACLLPIEGWEVIFIAHIVSVHLSPDWSCFSKTVWGIFQVLVFNQGHLSETTSTCLSFYTQLYTLLTHWFLWSTLNAIQQQSFISQSQVCRSFGALA